MTGRAKLSEDDPRLVEDDNDEWLNGMDEFAVMVGIYSRWVFKAGKKDGRRKADVLEENEDSNHIWSRLVIYFSEPHLGLLGLIKEFKADPEGAAFVGVNDQIELVLRTLGARARPEPFDARAVFDVVERRVPQFAVRPAHPRLAVGSVLSFEALSADGPVEARWSSSTSRIAVALGGSIFRAVEPGEAEICASASARRSCTTVEVRR